MPTLISDVKELQAHHDSLRALAYETVEEFLGALNAAPRHFEKYLGTDLAGLTRAWPGAAGMLDQVASEAANLPAFSLGASLTAVSEATVAYHSPLPPATAAAPVAATVNLIPHMPPILNQANRGTCVSFSSIASLENLRTIQGKYHSMSEQFLYFQAKGHDGHPTQEGTWISVAMSCLQNQGCCLQTTWPYNPNPIPGNEGEGPAPARASVEALLYRIAKSNGLAPTSVQSIKNELLRQRCISFAIPVFNSWYRNPVVARTGDLVLPVPGETAVGGHAMCICGYEDLPASPQLGGGRFFLRNSWGTTQWGTQSPLGAGYGTIPYAYIASYASEAYSIE